MTQGYSPSITISKIKTDIDRIDLAVKTLFEAVLKLMELHKSLINKNAIF